MSAKPLLRVFEKMQSSCASVKPVNGIVLVDVDGQAVQGHVDPRRLEAVLRLEGVFLLGLHLPRHRPKLRRALRQGRRGGGRALALDLNLHVGIQLAESPRPNRSSGCSSVSEPMLLRLPEMPGTES